jgi:glucan phosphoethanolaminetransferase (alkaline phosphatase superfamily)
MPASRLDIFSWAVWWVLLVLPATTLFASQHSWDLAPYGLVMVTLWAVLLAWTIGGRRWFLLATGPLAVLGALLVAAVVLRHVNLAELAMVGAMRTDEALAALGPYLWATGLLAAALLALALRPVLAGPEARPAPARWRRPAIALLALAGAGMAAASPGSFLRAWPINLAALGMARATGQEALLATMLPYAPINPRNPAASWQARRAEAPAVAETYVLIVGESVRSDRLAACGNARAVRPATPGILSFCDVMAGSSSTHTSVPLLLSRESPGGLVRVSSDATFMKAFEQAGFDTWWLSVQEAQIAWPDARHVEYASSGGRAATRRGDRELLAPLLQRALAAPAQKKLIVLHTYDAHFNYCERFDRTRPDFPVDCAGLEEWPSGENRPALLAAYDNAVQESLRLVDHVIASVAASGAVAVVLYTSDHGENIFDDKRQLFQHALKTPTRWDTRVPALLWASPAWKQSQPARWQQLQANLAAPVMHADLVPTLLGAAGIAYTEPRAQVVDLGAARPGPRVRTVLRHLGETMDGDSL